MVETQVFPHKICRAMIQLFDAAFSLNIGEFSLFARSVRPNTALRIESSMAMLYFGLFGNIQERIEHIAMCHIRFDRGMGNGDRVRWGSEVPLASASWTSRDGITSFMDDGVMLKLCLSLVWVELSSMRNRQLKVVLKVIQRCLILYICW